MTERRETCRSGRYTHGEKRIEHVLVDVADSAAPAERGVARTPTLVLQSVPMRGRERDTPTGRGRSQVVYRLEGDVLKCSFDSAGTQWDHGLELRRK